MSKQSRALTHCSSSSAAFGPACQLRPCFVQPSKLILTRLKRNAEESKSSTDCKDHPADYIQHKGGGTTNLNAQFSAISYLRLIFGCRQGRRRGIYQTTGAGASAPPARCQWRPQQPGHGSANAREHTSLRLAGKGSSPRKVKFYSPH